MSNKKLEQAIEEQSRKTVNRNFYDLQEADARERHFKMGAQFILENLHLLSPSDVAKIPCVRELIEVCVAYEKHFEARYGNSPMPFEKNFLKMLVKSLSNFEPKKEGAE